jgi:CDGSH-type Zn-finger protein/mannose-6-phosphate isomerase-like protein (cupin superfamily)
MSSRDKEQRIVAQRKPYLVELHAGRDYFWCSCGQSAGQPYCDGSHTGTTFTPLRFTATQDGEAVLCGCKRTRTPPYCDGTHNKLSERYQEATEDELSNAASLPLARRDHSEWGKAVLAQGCFVLTPAAHLFERRSASIRLLPVIHRGDGARFISQFYADIEPGSSDILHFPHSEAALFVRSGTGTITISGREFPVGPEAGILVRPDEGFRIRPEGEGMKLLLTACPQAQAPESLASMPTNFDESVSRRVCSADALLREPMADRFYQVLVGERPDESQITEFIGEIPLSRAAAHRHLYEEAIMILAGEGFLWTEQARAAVAPGDILFLPRKVLHSLECTSPTGLRLMGVFYPSGSPAVNY